MNIADAAYLTVHDYPGGSEALAPRVGMPGAVLRNKVNPNNTTHKLTFAEASRIVGVTGDVRMVQAFAAEHGGVVTFDGGAAPAGSVLDLVLGEAQCGGEFARVLREALSDNRISENEMRDLASAGLAMQQSVMHLLARLKAGRVVGNG